MIILARTSYQPKHLLQTFYSYFESLGNTYHTYSRSSPSGSHDLVSFQWTMKVLFYELVVVISLYLLGLDYQVNYYLLYFLHYLIEDCLAIVVHLHPEFQHPCDEQYLVFMKVHLDLKYFVKFLKFLPIDFIITTWLFALLFF